MVLQNCGKSPQTVLFNLLTKITIEPALLLYAFAWSMGYVFTQSLAIRKYCLIYLAQPAEICDNLTNYTDIEEAAQALTTDFIMYKTLLDTIPTIFLAGFIGSWSDKNGRKLLLIVPCISACVGTILMALNAYFESDLQVEYILIASVPYAVGGNLLTLMTGSFSYIADKTAQEERTIRIALVQAAILGGAPLGTIIGGIIFNTYGYVMIYGISASAFLLAGLYVIIFIKESVKKNDDSGSCSVCSLFDLTHFTQLFKTVFKKRDSYDRLHIILLVIASTIIYLPLMSEFNLLLLYTRWKFHWSELEFTEFLTVMMVLSMIGLLTCLPLLSALLKIHDLTLGIFSCFCNILRALVLCFSYEGWILYAASPIFLFTEISTTIPKTAISKIVAPQDQGKIMSAMTAVETSVPLIGIVLYSTLYNSTRASFPGAIFVFSASMTLIPAMIFGCIRLQRTRLAKNPQFKPQCQSPTLNIEAEVCTHM